MQTSRSPSPSTRIAEQVERAPGIRRTQGAAAVLDAAARARIPTVLDGKAAVEGVLLALARKASFIAFSAPGLSQLAGTRDPGGGLRRVETMLASGVGLTLGAEGFLWR